jgi:hypothetical protein
VDLGVPALRISSAHESIGVICTLNPMSKLNFAACSDCFFPPSDSNCNKSLDMYAYCMHTQVALKQSQEGK